MTTVTNERKPLAAICLQTLDNSWKTVELIMDDGVNYVTCARDPQKAMHGLYELYRRFSGTTEFSVQGFAEALRNDLTNATLRYCGIKPVDMVRIKSHFETYHPMERRTDLPGYYTWAINEWFKKHFPSRN